MLNPLSVIRRTRVSAPRSAPAYLWGSVVVLLALAAAGTWFTSPRAFLIEQVQFSGNQRATAGALRHLVDVPNGSTHLTIDRARIADRAEQHPWVREAWVQRSLHGIEVVVDEHRPVALAQLGSRLVYIDDRGDAFLDARSDDLDYPVITGLDDEVRGLHPALAQVVLRDAVLLIDRADERGLIDAGEVSQVAFGDTRGFTVHLRNGTEVLFGLDRHAEQLDRLSQLLTSGVDLGEPTYVDLAPERVAIVRPLHRASDG